MTDEQLILEYRDRGAQPAFEQLMGRYAGLVFGTARRHVGDAFVAEEICQEVFSALAAQAGSIRKPAQLPCWLYHTTRRLAARHVRNDQRRRARERTATLMNSDDSGSTELWEGIEPLLNEGLDRLSESDRTAILLRFFRGLPMAEVAGAMGTSEPAAKMRIGRAVEKLRNFFARHGIACSAVALLTVLQAYASAQPPASIAGSLSTWKPKFPSGRPNSPMVPSAGQLVRAGAVLSLGGILAAFLWANRTSPATNAAAPSPEVSTEPAEASQPAPVLETAATQPKAAVPKDKLRLTVLDANSLKPLAGVKVMALSWLKQMDQAVTDTQGQCDLSRATDTVGGDFYHQLRASYDGYATMVVSWAPWQRDELQDIPAAYTLKMFPGTRVGGIVTDEERQPLANVEVKIKRRRPEKSGPPPRARAFLDDMNAWSWETVRTDSQGRWSFDRLLPAWEDLLFHVSGTNYISAEYQCDARIYGASRVPKDDFLALRASMTLRRSFLVSVAGQVVDQHQTPIAGVRVIRDFGWVNEQPAVQTGSDGTYLIPNVPTGPVRLTFVADHYVPRTIDYSIAASITNPAVILAPGHLLTGHVKDKDGLPLAGVEVQLLLWEGIHQDYRWRAWTDESGAFAWDSAPERLLPVSFRKPGFQPTDLQMVPNGSDQNVTLRPAVGVSGIRLHGRVVDRVTGEAIPTFEVYLGQNNAGPTYPHEGMDGEFAMRVEGSSDTLQVEVRAAGYAPALSEAIPATNGDQTISLKLRRAEGLTGWILRPNGGVAAGAEIALAKDSPVLLGRRKLMGHEKYPYTQTDDGGRFHFDANQGTGLIVAVAEQGYAELDSARLAANPVLRLQPWGRVEGQVRASGQSWAGQTMALARDLKSFHPLLSLSVSDFAARIDDDGHFAFEDVPPVELNLGHVSAARVFEQQTNLQVNPGEPTAVTLKGN